MQSEKNYIELNKHSWNNRVDAHLASAFYDVEGFLKGNTSLNDIELKLLGDVSGKSILHLQCHFGQDSISLARLGARVTGVDLSDKAIDAANDLAKKTCNDVTFICCDVYDLANHLKEQFDIVFTSYGTIGWLPDMNKWAIIIATFLKPNGRFVFAEFHPVVWMYDDNFETIKYNYFNAGQIVESETGTYADKDAPIKTDYIGWNHDLSEVFTSLIKNGIEINSFEEYDYSPYNCFAKTVEFEPKKFRIAHFGNKIPMVFAIAGTKKVQG
jgi:2-polyprenyl-3-methyl-5-hydroxy-6-metoxy-1,4-benzoquinol methylase